MTELYCLRCGGLYEQSRRRASHFCAGCRETKRTEYKAAWERRKYAMEREVRGNADTWIETRGIDHDYAIERLYPKVDDYIEEMASSTEGLIAVVPDRQPAGTLSPAGSDDGVSTYFTGLAEDVYGPDWRMNRNGGMAAAVAAHEWFTQNPHWCYELHNPEKARMYLDAA